MAIGRRTPKQDELFIPTAKLAAGPGHPFYTKLNAVLAEAGFDEFVENLCEPYYKEGGRPGIPPGVYFRMLFIGYFEGLDSQRGIAWRCADSLGLRTFLGFRLTYKAEHAVDLESEAIVAATVTFADKSDPQSGPVTLSLAEANLVLAGSATEIEETVMDKGYHDNAVLAGLAQRGLRTYIPERRQKGRCWTDKPLEQEEAYRANRRRVRGKKGRRLNRWRSERCERTFAHVCETGGGRRAWLRGQTNVSKAHTLKCAAYNLGVLLRKVWGMRKPRNADEGVWGAFWPVWPG
jgi:hypothetical protein